MFSFPKPERSRQGLVCWLGAEGLNQVSIDRCDLARSDMRLVYTHPNSILVGSMGSLLGAAGIEFTFRNELLAGASGEIAPGETWMEVWVVKDEEADTALTLISQVIDPQPGNDWSCAGCTEANPSTFETCWHCGKAART